MIADFRGMIEPDTSMISLSRTELLSSMPSPLICPLRLWVFFLWADFCTVLSFLYVSFTVFLSVSVGTFYIVELLIVYEFKATHAPIHLAILSIYEQDP
jgi:hypothetical protein